MLNVLGSTVTVSIEYETSDISPPGAWPGCSPWAAAAAKGEAVPDSWVEGVLACGFWDSDTTRLLRQGAGMPPARTT